MDLRQKNILSRQNILSGKQIAADIEEKHANQGEALHIHTCGGISHIHLSLSSKWKPCHRSMNNRPSNLRTTLEKYF